MADESDKDKRKETWHAACINAVTSDVIFGENCKDQVTLQFSSTRKKEMWWIFFPLSVLLDSQQPLLYQCGTNKATSHRKSHKTLHRVLENFRRDVALVP